MLVARTKLQGRVVAPCTVCTRLNGLSGWCSHNTHGQRAPDGKLLVGCFALTPAQHDKPSRPRPPLQLSTQLLKPCCVGEVRSRDVPWRLGCSQGCSYALGTSCKGLSSWRGHAWQGHSSPKLLRALC